MSSTHPASAKDGFNFYLLLALLLATLMMAINWVGYDGADDLSYALAAEKWLSHFPVLGSDHWALRHTIVIPVAASLALFGQREISLCLPNVAFFLGFIAVNHHFASRHLGPRTGGILAILLALTPAFIVQATYINIDLAEAFFVSLSFWLMISGTAESGKPSALFWSGIAAGLAFLTRETSLVLIAFLGLNFLFLRPALRLNYLLVGAGFALVVGAEMVYFWALSGDFFYRFDLDAHHDAVNRSLMVNQTSASGKILNREGAISVSVILDPFLMLFASQKFGLLFWLAIPMAIWLKSLPRTRVPEQKIVWRIAAFMLLWILFISSASFILYLVPRYYFVPAWGSTIILAYGFDQLLNRQRLAVAAATLSALMIVNALSLYVENTNPRFAERAMVEYLRTHAGIVLHTDPDAAKRVALLARFAGVDQRISSAPAQTGESYFYSPRNLELCGSAPRCAPYHPDAHWMVTDRFQEKPRAIGWLLRSLHVAPLIPAQIMEKIEQPSPAVTVYRVTVPM